jgi:hypothetical protein
MMSGITSPARPWFKLTLPQPDLANLQGPKLWLSEVGNRMGTLFLKSNLYNALPTVYGDLGVFATAAMLVEDDPDTVFRFTPLPIGSYSIGSSEGKRIDILVREFQMTVRQIVEKFCEKDSKGNPDLSNVSDYVKVQWEAHQREVWVDVCHLIKPNNNYSPGKSFSKYKRYSSIYYEKGVKTPINGSSMDYNEKNLRESGFDFFPCLVPRWEVTGEDFWGTSCPGMVALGDVKQLQLGEKRAAQAIEKMIYPAMVASTKLRNAKTTLLAGDITYVDEMNQGTGFRPAHEIRFSLQELEGKQEQIRYRVSRAFYEDLFLMLANSDRRQITAREIDERHEEKLLALGPVLEQLNEDLLDPLIDIAFAMMEKRGLIPEPPPEIQGMDLKVEYISVMAQAQKLVGLGAIERFTGFSANLLSVYPEIKNKIDAFAMIDSYADLTSVPTGIVRPTEEVKEEMAMQAAEQQRQVQMQENAMQAQSAKTLSETKTGQGSALDALLAQAEAGQLTDV